MVINHQTLCKASWRARRCPWKNNVEKKILRKKIKFFSLYHPSTTHECPQKISAQSVQLLAGHRQHIYIYECLVLFYWYCISFKIHSPLFFRNEKYVIKLFLKLWILSSEHRKKKFLPDTTSNILVLIS